MSGMNFILAAPISSLKSLRFMKHVKCQSISTQLTKCSGAEQNVDKCKDLELTSKEGDDSKKKKGKSKNIQLTTPNVPPRTEKPIRSCLSLHVGTSSITWSRFSINDTAPCDLTHWRHYDIVSKRKHINDLIKECLYIDHVIPEADYYVIENPQVAQTMYPGSAAQVNVNTQQAQLIAIMSFALANRKDSDIKDDQKLFFLRKFLSSRLFNTLVGTERVSTGTVIMDLLRTHYNVEDAPKPIDGKNDETFAQRIRGNVSVDYELRNMYNTSEGYQKEFLGQTLLLGLTFIRLCLLKCPDSLAKIKN